MVLIKNLTQSQINGVVDNFRGEVVTNADTNKLMFNTGTEFTYLVYSDLNNIITGLAGIEATNITGTLQTAAQPNVTSLGTLTGLTVNNNLSLPQHNGIDKGLTLGGDLVTSSAEQLNYVNTTPGTAEANKALVLDENLSIVGLSNLETDNLTVNGTLVTSSAIELNYVDVDTLGIAQASKALVVDADRNITNINTLEADFIQVNGTLVTSSAIELNYVDVDTLGVAQASKAVVLDANRNINNLNDVTAVNLTGTLQTAAQPNITSVGDLTGLNVDGVASVDSLIVNGVPLDAFKLDSLKMRVYSTPDFSGRVIKADIIPSVDFTDYEPVTGVTENYSMEIWGYIKPLYTESYTFTVTSNDKFRLWVNNEMVRADWTEGDDTNLQTSPIALTAGKWYPLYIQHSQLTGTERLSFRWSSATQVSEVVPSTALAYDDKALPVIARKTYTQDSINLYDSANTTLSTIGVNGSGDITITSASNIVNVAGHNGVDQGLKLDNVLVTSTAVELNYVDTTVGSAAANKAVVLNADKDYAGVRNITTIGNMGVNTTTPSKQMEINSATGDVLRLTRDAEEGNAINYADMTIDADGKLTINSSGDETVIHSSDNFNVAGHNGSTLGLKLNGTLVTSTAAELNYVDTTPGTAEASKALILSVDRNISNINSLSTSTLASISTTDSTSVSTGAITTAGGVGIAKSVNVGGKVSVLDTTNSTSAATGALTVSGGAGIKKALYVGEEGEETTVTNTTGGAPLGSNWTDITPVDISKNNNAWLGTAWSDTNNRFVVVGSSSEGNNIIHSTDGSAWTKVGVGKSVADYDTLKGEGYASSNETVSWSAIAYNGSVYVAVSNVGSQVMTSTNGTSWTNGTISGACASVCWSEELSLFVAVGNNRILTSSNGSSWTPQTTPATGGWTSVCWSVDLGLFAAVSNYNAIITSPDGITWTPRTSPATRGWESICWAGGSIQKFIAVAADYSNSGSNLMVSSNGISWTVPTIASIFGYTSVCWSYDLDKIVAMTMGDTVVTSTNGTSWTVTSIGSTYSAVTWCSSLNRYVAIINSKLASSTNGTTWLTFTNGVSSNQWNYLVEGSFGTLIAVASTGSNRVLKITTGTSVDVAQSEMFDVAYASGMNKYVAIGRYSFGPEDNFFHAATSTNGTSWTYHENAAAVDAGTSDIYYNTNNLQMAYSSTLNRLVVVGGNVILHSTNGTNWTEIRVPNKPFNDIIWAGGSVNKFVAIGDGGLYSTSTDGINWTHNTHPSEEMLETIAYSPALNKFILKGIYNTYSSTNGDTWTIVQTAQEEPIPGLDGITWRDMQWVSETNQFVAVGYGHSKSLITSSDGVMWTSYTGIPNVDYEDFAYSPALNKIVVVARSGNSVGLAQSTWSEGVTTTETTTTPANGYFNLKGKADILGGIDVEGVVNMNNVTQSTSTTTGALVVDGGVGIAKNLNVGGTFSSTGDATLSANVSVTGPSLKIPVGNTAARPTGQLGQVRYNSETSQFEGYGAGSTWGSLGGVSDVDQDTKILAETAAGADNDELRFYNAGTESMRLTNVGLMGLGTTTPSKKLEINSSTGDVLRLTYDDADGSAVNYADMTISADGKLTINSSGDETIIHSSDNFNVAGHNGSTLGLKLADVLVTATAVELNYVDTTPGTAEASKALVLDSSRNIANINNLSATGDVLVVGDVTTSNLLLSSADEDDYASVLVSSNYVLQKTSTGFQWNTGASSSAPGDKIMELDNTLSVTVPQSLENITDSTTTATGALVVAGGVGIAKSLNVGDNLNVEGNVDVDGPSLRIPVGNTLARPVGELGQIRYNSETSQFEGYGAGNSWGSLGGVSDVDQDTKILAETAAGDDNDELRFYNAGAESMRLTSTGLLGLGTSAPAKKLEINSATGDVLRLTYNDTDGSAVNYVDLNVSDSGNLTINSVGLTTFIKDTNNFDIAGHNGSTVGLKLAGVLVTSTAAELNYVDTTPGTAEGMKALVLNGDRDISNINSLSTSTLISVSTTDSTSVSTGAITTAGGVGIAKNLNVGGIQTITNLTNATSTTTGALIVSGGVGISKSVYIGEVEGDGYLNLVGTADLDGDVNISGVVNMNNTAQSTDKLTGALVVDGGVGIAKNLNVGEEMVVSGDVTLSANVDVDGPSLRIPVGNTTARPVGVAGQIRYNSETSQFEGFGAGNAWGSLGGVTDVDQDTRISAETAAGDDNDELRFYNAGSETMRLTNVGLMGLGTSAPAKKLEINSATGDVLRLTYDDADGTAANYADMTISADGKLTINSSGDETLIHSSDNFNIAGHNGSTLGLKLAGTLVTATAVELNYVDTTPGAAEASKALVLDSARDINNINVLTADTINVTTFGAQDLTAENINTTGNVGINTSDLTFGLQVNEAAGNVLRLTYNDNSGSAPTSKADFTMDDSNNLAITAANSVNIAVHNGTDKGLKLAGVLVTSTATELNYVDTTPGTAEASKALVLNSSKDIVGINSISMNNLNLTYDSAVADTQGNPLTITRTTSETPANGLGVGISFKTENSANVNTEFGSIAVVASDITSGSEDGNFVVMLSNNGVSTEAMRLSTSSLFTTEIVELSDFRLKENFVDVSLEETHNRVMQLRLTDYNYIGMSKTLRGVIAQEVEQIIPNAVQTTEKNGLSDCKSVSTREISNHMLGSIQYLSKKLDETLSRLEQLSADFENYKQSHQ